MAIGARELKRLYRLIPASFFREPLNSLKRAQILVLNYADEIENPQLKKRELEEKFPHLKVYLARYILERFIDLEGAEYRLDDLLDKRLGALAAIGYPEGFFNKLGEIGLDIKRKIVYPDHHRLTQKEFNDLQYELLQDGISELIITAKDKYHLPHGIKTKIKIIAMEIKIEIKEEEKFLQNIKTCL